LARYLLGNHDMKINGITIKDKNVITCLEPSEYPYYRQDTEVELEDGEFKLYINEFGVESLEEVERLREVYSVRNSRMGVELYSSDTEVIWSRPVLSP